MDCASSSTAKCTCRRFIALSNCKGVWLNAIRDSATSEGSAASPHGLRNGRHVYFKFLHNGNPANPEPVAFGGVEAVRLGNNQKAGCH